MEKFECPKGKCFLSRIYPNSDASLACDLECHFKEGEDGHKHLDWYTKKYKDQWEELNKTESPCEHQNNKKL